MNTESRKLWEIIKYFRDRFIVWADLRNLSSYGVARPENLMRTLCYMRIRREAVTTVAGWVKLICKLRFRSDLSIKWLLNRLVLTCRRRHHWVQHEQYLAVLKGHFLVRLKPA